MTNLEDFMQRLCGSFDNKEQVENLQKQGITNFPYAKHINTICNDKITNLPKDTNAYFLVEESYYTSNDATHATPHLFLLEAIDETIQLTSYEIPKEYNKDTFTYENITTIDYNTLTKSEKFTPAIYHKIDDVWEGGSISMFSPVLKFTLFERFHKDYMEVTESMEVNGKRTFGFDEPIIYKPLSI